MQNLADLKLNIIQLTTCSDTCEIHTHVELVILNDETICPVCYLEADTQKLIEIERQKLETSESLIKFNMLHRKSIIQDNKLLDVNFKSFEVKSDEQQRDKEHMVDVYKRLNNNELINVWLKGKPGVGKSHLSISLLKALNASKDRTCLFVDVDEALRRIKGSFNNKESKYTEEYVINLLSEVDFLVLDDIGAETGNIDTEKEASDWTNRVLRAIINSRQDKVTIFTTNLSSSLIRKMYDEKLVSRMFRDAVIIKFENEIDNRTSNIEF